VRDILQNAVKFKGESPVRWIRVRATDRGRLVHIDFQDSGPGISEAARERIFEPYVRATGPTDPALGLGLGLATVKRLVAAHGGRVWVESAEGKGSLFVVELPKASAGDPRCTGDLRILGGSGASGSSSLGLS
jgi:signal transduction histidine kinase